jgi:hypothetical protein
MFPGPFLLDQTLSRRLIAEAFRDRAAAMAAEVMIG